MSREILISKPKDKKRIKCYSLLDSTIAENADMKRLTKSSTYDELFHKYFLLAQKTLKR